MIWNQIQNKRLKANINASIRIEERLKKSESTHGKLKWKPNYFKGRIQEEQLKLNGLKFKWTPINDRI